VRTFLCMPFTFRAIRNSLPSCFISTSALQATKFLSCSCVGLFVGVCVFACVRVRNRVVVCRFSTLHMCPIAGHEYLALNGINENAMFTPCSHHVHTIVISTNLNVLFFDDRKRLPDFRRGIEPAPDHFQRHPPGVFCTQLHVD
jgi:hypothetical protein